MPKSGKSKAQRRASTHHLFMKASWWLPCARRTPQRAAVAQDGLGVFWDSERFFGEWPHGSGGAKPLKDVEGVWEGEGQHLATSF